MARLRLQSAKPLLLLNLGETGAPFFDGDEVGTLLQLSQAGHGNGSCGLIRAKPVVYRHGGFGDVDV
jgi:hypothetical protein